MVPSIPFKHEQFYLVSIICLHLLKWIHLLQSNTKSFICSQLNGFKYHYVILTIRHESFVYGTLAGSINLDQYGHGRSSNQEELHFSQSSTTGASPSDCFVSYRTFIEGVLPFYRCAVGVFYRSNRLGYFCV